ncbi:MAG: septum formation initiator family protein [Proteobacteria bacterium]|nr:septum formation initiator family protein [Pseudomonadota bacterium]
MLREIKDFFGNSWPYLFTGFILVYFVYHLIGGEHGLIAWRHLDAALKEHQKTLKTLKMEEDALETWVKQMKNPINPDLLEEQAGRRLNLHHSEDRILLLPQNENPQHLAL